ncbi:P-loop containing nucleoside triphosphate hydrolase protein [Spinellus fusiger]|nr:P-loop containing nucleoside triphosphate hydrolase protein [Spinellus fusiger]
MTQENDPATELALQLLQASLCNDAMTNEEKGELTRTLKQRWIEGTLDDMVYLATRVTSRMDQGKGETLLDISAQEDGTSVQLTAEEYEASKTTLQRLLSTLGADHADLNSTPADRCHRKAGYFMLRRKPASVEDILEIRIAVVGNVDAGKSTLLGVLTKGVLDDGRGKARLNLFRHKHEIESGRTSSVGSEMLGFTADSKPVMAAQAGRTLTWEEVCAQSAKVLSFFDLAGHEKYLKTTVFGMTGNAPEFAMLMVGANSGMVGMTKEHLGLSLSLTLPVFVVVTKIDRCPKNILQETLQELTKVLKSKSCRKIPLFVESSDDVIMTAQSFVTRRLCPIFKVSNVTGQGLNELRMFLNILPSLTHYDTEQPFYAEMNETYSVPFVGTVVSCVVQSGLVHVGDRLLVGPDYAGAFVPTVIKGIHRKRVSVPIAKAGQSVTFALKNIRRSTIRKGMVLLSHEKDQPPPKVSRRFEAEIVVLYHSTTIRQQYQAMVHCGAVRQTASIVSMEQQVLRTGDRAVVKFEFVKNPEYLAKGARLIFREGRTKGIGQVTRLLD